jgi:hypothetical protein
LGLESEGWKHVCAGGGIIVEVEDVVVMVLLLVEEKSVVDVVVVVVVVDDEDGVGRPVRENAVVVNVEEVETPVLVVVSVCTCDEEKDDVAEEVDPVPEPVVVVLIWIGPIENEAVVELVDKEDVEVDPVPEPVVVVLLWIGPKENEAVVELVDKEDAEVDQVLVNERVEEMGCLVAEL